MDFHATLVIMAAGMGSRFGGLKQAEPVGKDGQAIVDYSVYDAVEAGFDKVVFIIKKAIEKDLKRKHLIMQVKTMLHMMRNPSSRQCQLSTLSKCLRLQKQATTLITSPLKTK